MRHWFLGLGGGFAVGLVLAILLVVAVSSEIGKHDWFFRYWDEFGGSSGAKARVDGSGLECVRKA